MMSEVTAAAAGDFTATVLLLLASLSAPGEYRPHTHTFVS